MNLIRLQNALARRSLSVRRPPGGQRGRIAPESWWILIFALLVQPAEAARHALLIGIGNYAPSGLPNLPGAQEDVRIMREVLATRLAVPRENIQMLLDEAATHRGIERALHALAERIAPGDFVYLHYSGHGSYLRDANDDEWRSGQDQTWVGFGARQHTGDARDLDQYDILDDELNQWLGPIAERAGELVYVADTCYSATNTRGAHAPRARAAPPADAGRHPLREAHFRRYPLEQTIRIGAARDDEQAHEYHDEQGIPYGLFTWSWAQALMRAEHQATWRQVFERARLGVRHEYLQAQHPQLSGGDADRPLSGGAALTRTAAMITEVDQAARTVRLNVGRLSNVTPESLYAREDPQRPVSIRIQETAPTWSTGVIEDGAPQVGDFLVEREHAYHDAPLRIFLLAPRNPDDQPLAARLRRFVATELPGFTFTDRQDSADLILDIRRPEYPPGDREVPGEQTHRRPESTDAPDTGPAVWVLTPTERLLHAHLIFPFKNADPAGALEELSRNLQRYRRLRDIQRLAAESVGQESVALELIRYDRCDPTGTDCQDGPGGGYRRRPNTLPLSDLTQGDWRSGDLISFVLMNQGRRERYAYLLDVTPAGQIQVIFPARDRPASEARLQAGERLNLDEARIALLLDQPGEETLLLLVTRDPIDPVLLEQDGYIATRGTGRKLNPLERLLSEAAHGRTTRGGVIKVRSRNWGLNTLSFEVHYPTADSIDEQATD